MSDRNLELALKIKALVEGVNDVEQLADEVKGLVKDAGKEVPDITREMRAGAEQTVLSVQNLKTAIAGLVTAEAVRRFIDVNASMESLEKSLEAVTGSSKAAAAEMAFISEQADRLGIEIGAAAQSYLTLAAATKGTALEGQKTRDIWSAVAGRMAELGASSAAVEGAMVQLAQGASKGKFELEDLKSITERIPGFFDLAAKAMGVTTERFFEMVSAGQVTADFLPQLARQLGGSAKEIDTFNANLARLKNAFSGLATAIGSTGIFDAFSLAVRKTAESINLLVASAKLVPAAFGDEATLNRARTGYENATSALFGLERASHAAGVAGESAGRQIAAGMGQAVEAAKEASKELATAYKTLGLDPEVYRSGLTTVERETVDAFKRLAADPNVSGRALLEGLLASLDRVSKDAAPELAFAWKSLARDQPFKDTKLDLDQAAVGMEAIKTKTAGLWPELNKNVAEAKTLAKEYASLADQASKLRADAAAMKGPSGQASQAGAGPVQDNNEVVRSQASSTMDLINAEQKLQRIRGTDNSVAQIQAQAEEVRRLALAHHDQERGQEALGRTAQVLYYIDQNRVKTQSDLANQTQSTTRQTEALNQSLSDTSGLDSTSQKVTAIATALAGLPADTQIKVTLDAADTVAQITAVQTQLNTLAAGVTVPIRYSVDQAAIGQAINDAFSREAMMRGARR